MQTAVEQGGWPVGNPDALLFVFDVRGTLVVEPHCCAGLGGLNDIVWPLGAAKPTVPDRRSHSRNRRYRDRSNYR